MITLLDYGAGNVRSVINAFIHIGERIKVAREPEDIMSAEILVFPGVGAFGSMIDALKKKGFFDPLREYIFKDRPFLGICLGLQALFEKSEESPEVPGLCIFRGIVRRFRCDLSIPHMGWNGLSQRKSSRIFNGLRGVEKFYFVHSYHVDPVDSDIILTTTDYGYPFVSAIEKGNIIAVQFHPEKSGKTGLRILENFLSIAKPRQWIFKDRKTRFAKRIIACLDVRSNDEGDLVVTKGDRYDVREEGRVRNLGKPVSLARRYYQQGADEITFLNITGFRNFPLRDMPMLEVLKLTSENVFVPLTIGGGIQDYTDRDGRYYSALEVASEYFRSGADKVSIGTDAVKIAQDFLKKGGATGKSSIETISKVYGRQAVVVSIDPRRVYVSSRRESRYRLIETRIPGPDGERFCYYQCTVKGGREGRELDAITLAKICEELGAGEILLNCIDRDGTRLGYDIELIEAVKSEVKIPIIASSGAGKVEHFLEVFEKTDVEAALAAGIFHRNEVSIEKVKEYLKGKIEIRME